MGDHPQGRQPLLTRALTAAHRSSHATLIAYAGAFLNLSRKAVWYASGGGAVTSAAWFVMSSEAHSRSATPQASSSSRPERPSLAAASSASAAGVRWRA